MRSALLSSVIGLCNCITHYVSFIHTIILSGLKEGRVFFLLVFDTCLCYLTSVSVHTVYEYGFLEYDQFILSRFCSLITTTLGTDIQRDWGVNKLPSYYVGKLNNAAINSDLLRQTT